MRLRLLLETLAYLKPTQVVFQLRNRVVHPRLRLLAAPDHRVPRLTVTPIPKHPCLEGSRFTFLNTADDFDGWNTERHGHLWAYNLNYMDWVEDTTMPATDRLRWIDRFIDDLPLNTVGQEPYPLALRTMNWARFFAQNPQCISRRRDDSLWSQAQLLTRKLERHLMGNHLLEDAYALHMAAIYFADAALYAKATALLRRQLCEQLLADGAHYEQSPMYHQIMLDRLLDCINLSAANPTFSRQADDLAFLRDKARAMLGHLASITYADGTVPLFGDSARGIAPTPTQIFDYARRLGIEWHPVALGDCGYRHMSCADTEAFVDVGNVMASYQPGHSHADTLSYELRLGGRPFVVDTGVSTYDKNARREHERGTAAHNTVTVAGANSSQVWAGFRMGRRAHVTVLADGPRHIEAMHDGYGRHALHRRAFDMQPDGTFVVTDTVEGRHVEGAVVSRIHIVSGATPTVIHGNMTTVTVPEASICITGHDHLAVTEGLVADSYNRLHPCHVVEVRFTGTMSYTIVPTHAS